MKIVYGRKKRILFYLAHQRCIEIIKRWVANIVSKKWLIKLRKKNPKLYAGPQIYYIYSWVLFLGILAGKNPYNTIINHKDVESSFFFHKFLGERIWIK